MGRQEFHLIGQDSAISQNEVLPQRGHIRSVQQGHFGLFGCATAFSQVARAACGHHIHPGVDPLLGEWNDVLPCQFETRKQAATISAHVPVSCKEFAVVQPRSKRKGTDVWDASCADDAVDLDDGLKACQGVVPPAKNSNLRARLPANIVGSIMGHGLLERNPRLWQTLCG